MHLSAMDIWSGRGVEYRELFTRLVEETCDQRNGAYLGQRIRLAIQRGNVGHIACGW